MKKKKKKKPGRPKAKDPKKYVCSVRLTKEEMKKVRAKYKTFASMIKQILATLSVAILITSCGGSGGGTAASIDQAPEAGLAATTGQLYAISVNIQKPYSLGYDLSYTCSGNTCSITGELHHWNTAGTYVARAQINSGNLEKSGSVYVGTFFMVNGQHFTVSVNIDQNFIKIDNGSKCTLRTQTSTQAGYDAYLGSVTNVEAAISFNALNLGQCEL